jgi:hypothetical protein
MDWQGIRGSRACGHRLAEGCVHRLIFRRGEQMSLDRLINAYGRLRSNFPANFVLLYVVEIYLMN